MAYGLGRNIVLLIHLILKLIRSFLIKERIYMQNLHNTQ